MEDPEAEERHRQRVRLFSTFLAEDFLDGKYSNKVKNMMVTHNKRLILDIDDIRQFDNEVCKDILSNPGLYLPAFSESLRLHVASLQAQDAEEALKEQVSPTISQYHVGLEGSFGANLLNPRELSSSHIGQLVCVEGIVTKCSLVRPKLQKSVHFCQQTGETMQRTYRDATDGGMPTSTIYPTKDKDNNPLITEFGLCEYKDHQMVTIQEMPERSPAGQLPCSVSVVLENDLVDKAKPGDRIQCIGTFMALPNKKQGKSKGIFRTIMVANHARLLTTEVAGPLMTDEDISNIHAIGERKDVFSLLSSSLAPSIYGHEYVKKALLLQLLGGCEKNLENKTHIRGDINVLMVGDPSTAKSQLLRYMLHIAPLAISTSGRGSSGVGLTAAVTNDSETGERRLEAGAMVLADRGLVCIDEFDKMSVDDRVAIHEVMEQQTVTIAKAGIHTSLNARCAVLAAANPVYGQYNRTKRPTENIALPDSLLSRFDLLFIVLDTLHPEHDRAIADHVLRMHRYRRPGEADGAVVTNERDVFSEITAAAAAAAAGAAADDDAKAVTAPVYQKHDRILHGGSEHAHREILSLPFLQKYITYAKSRRQPKLSEEAAAFLVAAYSKLRGKEDSKTLPVTARTLETMIRLSEAHAKARLGDAVTVDDAQSAIAIMNYALYHEASPADSVRRMATEKRDGNDDEDDDDDVGAEEKTKKKKRSLDETDDGEEGEDGEDDVVDDDDDDDDNVPVLEEDDAIDDENEQHRRAVAAKKKRQHTQKKQKKTSSSAYAASSSAATAAASSLSMAPVDAVRSARFVELMQHTFRSMNLTSMSLSDLVLNVNDEAKERRYEPFDEDEARRVLRPMHASGLLTFTADYVFLT